MLTIFGHLITGISADFKHMKALVVFISTTCGPHIVKDPVHLTTYKVVSRCPNTVRGRGGLKFFHCTQNKLAYIKNIFAFSGKSAGFLLYISDGHVSRNPVLIYEQRK